MLSQVFLEAFGDRSERAPAVPSADAPRSRPPLLFHLGGNLRVPALQEPQFDVQTIWLLVYKGVEVVLELLLLPVVFCGKDVARFSFSGDGFLRLLRTSSKFPQPAATLFCRPQNMAAFGESVGTKS